MRKIFITLTVIAFNSVCVFAQSSNLDKKVDSLIAKMTLEEKVGQMTEVTSDVVSTTTNGNHQIDAEKLKEAILKYHVGSILNVSGHAYDRKHWYDVISTIQNEAAKDRLKIPVIYGIDAIHGVTYTTGSTLFPQEIAMAATFNRDLAHRA